MKCLLYPKFKRKTLAEIIMETTAYMVSKYPIADWLNDYSIESNNIPISNMFNAVILQATKEDAEQFKLSLNLENDNLFVYVDKNKTVKILSNDEYEIFKKLKKEILNDPKHSKYVLNNFISLCKSKIERSNYRIDLYKQKNENISEKDYIKSTETVELFTSVLKLVSIDEFDISKIKKADGCIYRVTIPSEYDLFDLDLLLSQQSDSVKEVIRNLLNNTTTLKMCYNEYLKKYGNDITGKIFLYILELAYNKAGFESKKLYKKLPNLFGMANVHGFKYIEDDVVSYAIFNPKELCNISLIEI